MKKIIKKILKKPSSREQIKQLDKGDHPVSGDLKSNVVYLKQAFDRCSDFIVREFEIATDYPIRVAMAYIDGLVNKQMITEDMIKTFMYDATHINTKGLLQSSEDFQNLFTERLLAFTEVKTGDKMKELFASLLTGETVLLVNGLSTYFAVSTQSWKQRAISEPETEAAVRGPKEGFTESLQTNITLIRRRIKTPRLKFETFKVGTLTNTAVCISYIDGIVNDKIVAEVKERLQRIKIDGVLESGYIEEYIEEAPFSMFPTIHSTERPDKVAGGLLEGQVCLIVDTTPFALLLPVTFPQLLQASEDYYLRWPFASFVRVIRFAALNIALLAAPFYIAIVTYHQEMLPTPLLISVAAAREGVPFPAFVEALLMEATFEVLREAGVRLPKTIGQAVSIVGALVIGEAAVTAGLVSTAMVIIVATTAIASFTIPSYSGAYSIRILRFPLMALAAALGLFGIMVGLLIMLIHLCSLRSFGVPYISPLAPVTLRDLKDMFIRAPWWKMTTRPRLHGYKEPQRQGYGQMPKPPENRKRTANNSNKISRRIVRRKVK